MRHAVALQIQLNSLPREKDSDTMPGRQTKAGLPLELTRAVRKAAFAIPRSGYGRIREELTVEVRDMLKQGRSMAEVRAELLRREVKKSRQ